MYQNKETSNIYIMFKVRLKTSLNFVGPQNIFLVFWPLLCTYRNRFPGLGSEGVLGPDLLQITPVAFHRKNFCQQKVVAPCRRTF